MPREVVGVVGSVGAFGGDGFDRGGTDDGGFGVKADAALATARAAALNHADRARSLDAAFRVFSDAAAREAYDAPCIPSRDAPGCCERAAPGGAGVVLTCAVD